MGRGEKLNGSLNLADKPAPDREVSMIVARIAALTLRENISEFEDLVDQAVVSSGTQATMLKKLSKMALKRAQWSQKANFEAVGWPLVPPTAKIGDPCNMGEGFQRVLQGVFAAFFANTPVPEVYTLLSKFKGDESEEDSEILKDASLLLEVWRNDKTSYLSKKTGLVTDALRLKRGASTGLAVRCGVYDALGPAGQQEDLDFAEYEKVVQEELDALLDCLFR
jgi:hypothetical protein